MHRHDLGETALSLRLQTVADLLPKGCICADIGCDHGMLSEALLRQQIASAVIAVDVSEPSLAKAARRLAAHDLRDRAQTRLGDGFLALEPGEADCAVLAGLSAGTIRTLLENGESVRAQMRCIVVQPMSHPEVLRAALPSLGLRLADERLVCDAGRYYCVLRLEPGAETLHTDVENEFGWLLLKRRDPLLEGLVRRRLRLTCQSLDEIRNSRAARAAQQAEALDALRRQYEEVLQWFAK